MNSITSAPFTAEQLLHAAELVISTQFGSYNMIQKKLGVRYTTALEILAELERLGIVAPPKPSRAADVLVPASALNETLIGLRVELDIPPVMGEAVRILDIAGRPVATLRKQVFALEEFKRFVDNGETPARAAVIAGVQ